MAPRARFELATLRLTAETVKNLSAASGVASKNFGAILTLFAAPNPAPKTGCRLWREVHAAHQVLKARIRAQVIKPGIDLQSYHPCSPLLVGSFQPTESFVCFAQGCVDSGHNIRSLILLYRLIVSAPAPVDES